MSTVQPFLRPSAPGQKLLRYRFRIVVQKRIQAFPHCPDDPELHILGQAVLQDVAREAVHLEHRGTVIADVPAMDDTVCFQQRQGIVERVPADRHAVLFDHDLHISEFGSPKGSECVPGDLLRGEERGEFRQTHDLLSEFIALPVAFQDQVESRLQQDPGILFAPVRFPVQATQPVADPAPFLPYVALPELGNEESEIAGDDLQGPGMAFQLPDDLLQCGIFLFDFPDPVFGRAAVFGQFVKPEPAVRPHRTVCELIDVFSDLTEKLQRVLFLEVPDFHQDDRIRKIRPEAFVAAGCRDHVQTVRQSGRPGQLPQAGFGKQVRIIQIVQQEQKGAFFCTVCQHAVYGSPLFLGAKFAEILRQPQFFGRSAAVDFAHFDQLAHGVGPGRHTFHRDQETSLRETVRIAICEGDCQFRFARSGIAREHRDPSRSADAFVQVDELFAASHEVFADGQTDGTEARRRIPPRQGGQAERIDIRLQDARDPRQIHARQCDLMPLRGVAVRAFREKETGIVEMCSESRQFLHGLDCRDHSVVVDRPRRKHAQGIVVDLARLAQACQIQRQHQAVSQEAGKARLVAGHDALVFWRFSEVFFRKPEDPRARLRPGFERAPGQIDDDIPAPRIFHEPERNEKSIIFQVDGDESVCLFPKLGQAFPDFHLAQTGKIVLLLPGRKQKRRIFFLPAVSPAQMKRTQLAIRQDAVDLFSGTSFLQEFAQEELRDTLGPFAFQVAFILGIGKQQPVGKEQQIAAGRFRRPGKSQFQGMVGTRFSAACFRVHCRISFIRVLSGGTPCRRACGARCRRPSICRLSGDICRRGSFRAHIRPNRRSPIHPGHRKNPTCPQ